MEPVSQAPKKAEHPLVDPSSVEESFDVVVVGGGPAGATAAQRMAEAGHSVLLLDKAGRIKPCGGAIPPRLIRDFDIPTSLLCAQVKGARIISPAGREVDMQIDGGYVGMVDREEFDEFLRARAAERGATRRTASYERIDRDTNGAAIVRYQTEDGERSVRAALVIGADGARSRVAKQEVPGADIPFVFAYHEIVDVADAPKDYDALRCDVVYDGRISPDFYGWVFPHGRTASIGTGSAQKGKSIRGAVEALRAQAGLGALKTVRREGAPIPMKPMKQWDNGRDVVLAGDAAGVVAPASGEGIYYAMVGGELAAEAGAAFLATKDVRALTLARRRFMRMHGRVFWILGIMQHFWYGNDKRRERFVSMCRDPDVQQLTWQAYLNKELVRAKPAAHVRIFFKDLAHLMGIGAP
ncbi:MAG: geranylgeranyl diphosphate reductase [Deltaproteobacteria bacterium]